MWDAELMTRNTERATRNTEHNMNPMNLLNRSTATQQHCNTAALQHRSTAALLYTLRLTLGGVEYV
jgi:hypothetical protein